MQTRPSFINELDWKLLQEKYKNPIKLKKIIDKIQNDYPVQYAIGNVEFLDTKIIVNKNVLIPRFETELLVSKLLDYIKEYNFNSEKVIDMCTGSGCIAIALKKHLYELKVTAVDKSAKALSVAKTNAKKNKVDILFKRMDILKNVIKDTKYSVLVSNPPYVKEDEYVTPNTFYEPQIALYPGKDDLLFYKRILDVAPSILYKKNVIAFEIGASQAEEICKYAKYVFPDAKILVEKDYANFDRFIFIFNNCE